LKYRIIQVTILGFEFNERCLSGTNMQIVNIPSIWCTWHYQTGRDIQSWKYCGRLSYAENKNVASSLAIKIQTAKCSPSLSFHMSDMGYRHDPTLDSKMLLSYEPTTLEFSGSLRSWYCQWQL